METLPYDLIYEFKEMQGISSIIFNYQFSIFNLKEMHRFSSIIMNFEEIQFMLFTTIHGFYPIHDNGIVNSLLNN